MPTRPPSVVGGRGGTSNNIEDGGGQSVTPAAAAVVPVDSDAEADGTRAATVAGVPSAAAMSAQQNLQRRSSERGSDGTISRHASSHGFVPPTHSDHGLASSSSAALSSANGSSSRLAGNLAGPSFLDSDADLIESPQEGGAAMLLQQGDSGVVAAAAAPVATTLQQTPRRTPRRLSWRDGSVDWGWSADFVQTYVLYLVVGGAGLSGALLFHVSWIHEYAQKYDVPQCRCILSSRVVGS